MVVAQLSVVSAYAADTNDNRGQFSGGDYKFAKAAACGGMLEVNLGTMAMANSSNAAVRQFGQHMVTDHGKAGQDLAQIASARGASLPTQLTARQQKEFDRLAALSGPEFDKAYVAFMVKCHKTDATEFRRASESLDDPDLRAFAGSALAMVEDHLKMARDMDEKLKGE
jgi:putative membrane protein